MVVVVVRLLRFALAERAHDNERKEKFFFFFTFVTAAIVYTCECVASLTLERNAPIV